MILDPKLIGRNVYQGASCVWLTLQVSVLAAQEVAIGLLSPSKQPSFLWYGAAASQNRAGERVSSYALLGATLGAFGNFLPIETA